jgi:hypothetical protein
MLMFLATLSTSVVALFLVQAMDIECVKPPRRRASPSVKTEASYPNGAVAGAR